MDRFTPARAGLRAAALVPALGSRIALRMFFATQPRMPLRPDEEATDLVARRRAITVRGERVVTYTWGAGVDAALLVHGWRGRAAQFAPLVRELVAEGFRVVAFDAPGHGASTGRRTDIRDWLDAIRQLESLEGPFHLLAGHSFGALAALTAAREGVSADAVAALSGAGSPAVFIDRFADLAAIPERVRRRFPRDFARRIGESTASAARRYDAVAHPLPSHVALLAVHDTGDRQVPLAASESLVAAHGDRARLVRTAGWGHGRILGAGPLLDAVVALARGGLAAVDAARSAEAEAGAGAEISRSTP